MSIHLIIIGLVFLSLIYGVNLFVVWTHQCIFNDEMTFFCYLIPLFLTCYVALMFTFQLLKACGGLFEKIYSFFYIIFAVYIGYLLYIFITAIIIRIIDACVVIPKAVGISILYGLPGIICIYGIINALITKVIKVTLKFPGYKDRTTILHLTDIHLGAIHQKGSIMRIVKEAEELNPDIVVITGDMADGSLKVKTEWLKPFDHLNMPILYVTGNHEEMNPTKEMLKVVNETKIKHIGRHGRYRFKDINFIGEDFGYNLRESIYNIKQEEGVPNVLLSHIPILKPEELSQYNIFLFLAGHTHGGQLFPLHIFAYCANACFSGLYSDTEKKHHVFVSEGVNNALPPMRVGCSRVFGMITIEGD